MAEEVRKLSEQSAIASKDIQSLIQDVQTRTQIAVTFMKESKREVEYGTELVGIAGRTFNSIVEMIRGIADEISSISAATEQLTAGTGDVVKAAGNIESQSQKISEESQTFSRTQLLNNVWSYDFEGDERAVDAVVKRLRRKLADTDFLYIHTVRGFGYRFEVVEK